MKFTQQRLFAYDKNLFQPETLQALLHGTTLSSFALSGVEDLLSNLLIGQEYFQQFPIITVKELKRTIHGQRQDIDSVYREPVVNARYQFDRIMKLSSYVSFADPDIKHGKQGQTLVQPINAAFCLLDLHDNDYFPATGDQVLFNGRLYDVAVVKVLVSDYFQNTMVPLYVHAVCGLHQFGDRLPPQVLDAGSVVHGAQPENLPLPEKSSVN